MYNLQNNKDNLQRHSVKNLVKYCHSKEAVNHCFEIKKQEETT